MANWPENTRLIRTEVPRLDGLPKASGRAKYPSDERPEGLLFGACCTARTPTPRSPRSTPRRPRRSPASRRST